MLKFIFEDVKSTVANRSKLMSVVCLCDIVVNYFFLLFTGSLFHSRSLTAVSSCWDQQRLWLLHTCQSKVRCCFSSYPFLLLLIDINSKENVKNNFLITHLRSTVYRWLQQSNKQNDQDWNVLSHTLQKCVFLNVHRQTEWASCECRSHYFILHKFRGTILIGCLGCFFRVFTESGCCEVPPPPVVSPRSAASTIWAAQSECSPTTC